MDDSNEHKSDAAKLEAHINDVLAKRFPKHVYLFVSSAESPATFRISHNAKNHHKIQSKVITLPESGLTDDNIEQLYREIVSETLIYKSLPSLGCFEPAEETLPDGWIVIPAADIDFRGSTKLNLAIMKGRTSDAKGPFQADFNRGLRIAGKRCPKYDSYRKIIEHMSTVFTPEQIKLIEQAHTQFLIGHPTFLIQIQHLDDPYACFTEYIFEYISHNGAVYIDIWDFEFYRPIPDNNALAFSKCDRQKTFQRINLFSRYQHDTTYAFYESAVGCRLKLKRDLNGVAYAELLGYLTDSAELANYIREPGTNIEPLMTPPGISREGQPIGSWIPSSKSDLPSTPKKQPAPTHTKQPATPSKEQPVQTQKKQPAQTTNKQLPPPPKWPLLLNITGGALLFLFLALIIQHVIPLTGLLTLTVTLPWLALPLAGFAVYCLLPNYRRQVMRAIWRKRNAAKLTLFTLGAIGLVTFVVLMKFHIVGALVIPGCGTLCTFIILLTVGAILVYPATYIVVDRFCSNVVIGLLNLILFFRTTAAISQRSMPEKSIDKRSSAYHPVQTYSLMTRGLLMITEQITGISAQKIVGDITQGKPDQNFCYLLFARSDEDTEAVQPSHLDLCI